MPIQLKEENGGKILAVHVSGRLAKADYEHFVPEFERLVLQHGKLRVLFDMTGFHGWDAGALWEDIKFDIKHFADIERVAMIGEKSGSRAWRSSANRSRKRPSGISITLAPLRRGSGWAKRREEQDEMNMQKLVETAKKMVADDKGLLAMDESNPTCNKRFAPLGIPQTEEARRAYRELIVTTPGLGESISGTILYDETIRQKKKDGTPFVKALTDAGIIPGIKVDIGAKDLAGHPGEKITEGLDGLRDRLNEYFQMGARFAKWRAVIAMGDGIPSRSCIEANAHALGPLCRVVPGSRTGSGRRARGAHGRRAHLGPLRRSHGGSPANGFPPASRTTGDAGGYDPEAQHGASGIDLPQAGIGGRGGRRHGEVSFASRPRCRSGDCFPVGRPIR